MSGRVLVLDLDGTVCVGDGPVLRYAEEVEALVGGGLHGRCCRSCDHCPSNVSPPAVVFGVRQVLNLIRAIPELIFAIALMLPVFGLGPLAGALAIGVGSVGTLGKLTSEAIEGIDPGPVEAARSSGARPVAVLRWGVVPQVLPEVVAFWLYRFEINILTSAVLGVLGAGGIGSLLAQLFERRIWDRIGITVVVIVVVTVLVDQVSAAIRSRIIDGTPRRPAEAVL